MTPEAHIAELSAHFTAGRYDLMTSAYSFPLPVYVDDAPSVLESRRDLWCFFQSLHSRLAASGMPQLEGRLISVELPRSGRFRLWTEWTAIGCQERQLIMKTVCFNRGTHDSYLTEMLQLIVTRDMPLAALLRAA